MIRIGKPYIEKKGDDTTLNCRIVDEYQQIDEVIWYKTSSTWGGRFVTEVADGFLLTVLLQAFKYKEDIEVAVPISNQLFYNLLHHVLPILKICYHVDRVPDILPTAIVETSFSPQAVATGCSLGVDSFSTILQHTDDNCIKGFHLTHLTYFNVGALGSSDLSTIENSFLKDKGLIETFAEEIGLPLVVVDSNVHILFKDFSFNASHTFRNMSVVLSMQQLFKRYFYASAYEYSTYHITADDLAHFEDPILARLSTECTSIMSADANLKRTAKTSIITSHPITQKYLYVCLREQLLNDSSHTWFGKYLKEAGILKRNCSHCSKCLRTLITLDVLGVVEKYGEIFDVDYYHKVKKIYLAKVIGQRYRDDFFEDIYLFMNKFNYRIPIISKVLAPLFMINSKYTNSCLNRIFKFT